MKACKICHALTLELDETGRCLGCATAKAATDCRTTYGKFVAWQYAKEQGWQLPQLEPLPVAPEEVPTAPAPAQKAPKAKKAPVYLPCAQCGAEFRKTRNTQRFCCRACQLENHRISAKAKGRARSPKQGQRYCVVCGEPLPEEMHLTKITCSEECRIARHNQKARECARRQRAREAAKHG